MRVEDLVESSREICAMGSGDWQPKFTPVVEPRPSLLVNTVLFELKKFTIKWKQRLAHLAKRKFAHGVERHKEFLQRTFSNSDCSLMVELGAHLSSIIPHYSLQSSMGSSHSFCHNSRKLLDLDGASLLIILRFLNGRDVLSFAQVSHKLRNFVLKNIVFLERKKSNLYDLLIDFNTEKGREDVRALKCRRLVQDATYSGDSIRDLIPSLLSCQLRISFGNNVIVSRWLTEIHSLYKEKRLIPISLNFTGGCFTKGNQIAGADLRCFTERDFTSFISSFVPDLKEVQLSTTRLFKFSYSSRFLFAMINLLSVFGMIYERPSLCCSAEDICRILWRYSSFSHSCEVYLCRPRGIEDVDWSQFGGTARVEGNKVAYYHVGILLNWIT